MRTLSPSWHVDHVEKHSAKANRSRWLTDFTNAEIQFKKILAIDPYRIDDIDVYSNILYVTEKHLDLSTLAHEFLLVDKDRPEVCCLIGTPLLLLLLAFGYK